MLRGAFVSAAFNNDRHGVHVMQTQRPKDRQCKILNLAREPFSGYRLPSD